MTSQPDNHWMRFWMVALLVACGHPSTPAITTDVGTLTYTLVDATRADPIAPAKRRTWIVQLYYPSERTPLHDHYADDPVLVAALVAEQYYGATTEELHGWLAKPGFAATGAAPKHGTWPLITISPGLSFARLNYAELAAQLVARGYVVAVIDHPYLGISHVADAIVSADADPMMQSENPADSLPRVREWTRDISFVLDDLAAKPRGLGIDLHHVTATGHSIGGTAAIGACDDDRVRACIDFEGFLEGIDALEHGSQKPVLAAFSRAKGRPATLAPGAVDPMDKIHDQLASRGQPIWFAKVTGGSHTSFSDAPDVLPRTLSRFGGELMTPARSFEVYAGLVDAFARAYARDEGEAVLDAELRTLPEVAAHR